MLEKYGQKQRSYKRVFTERQAKLIYWVFNELCKMPTDDLRQLLGSAGATQASILASELRYYDYCKRNGIKYEDMTDEDYERAYHEEWDS